MSTYKCARCKHEKEATMFGVNRNDERSKTCIKCNKQKVNWAKTKKDFVFELNDEWKQHPKYKGYYCDELGHVINKKTKKLIGKLNDNGYIQLSLMIPELKMVLAHRFIVETWKGAIEEDMVINHINEKKCDNRLENLEIVTKSENNEKSTKKVSGQRKPKPCIGINQKTNEKFNYKSLSEAERKTGCGHPSIQMVCDGIINTTTSNTSGDIWAFKYKQ